MASLLQRPVRAVTFDCWNTLIFEPDLSRSAAIRAEALCDLLRKVGRTATYEEALAALADGWGQHRDTMRAGRSSGAAEVARWIFDKFEIEAPHLADEWIRVLEEASLRHGVRIVDGADECLFRLRAAGVRRGLICDTGLTPGRVVRKHLEQTGLLEYLEVLVFSDEVGIPKPSRTVFQRALRALDAKTEDALHVGDLKRSDVAGARDAGMRSVRLRARRDDRSALPEADLVVSSYAELLALLRV